MLKTWSVTGQAWAFCFAVAVIWYDFLPSCLDDLAEFCVVFPSAKTFSFNLYQITLEISTFSHGPRGKLFFIRR